MLVAVSYTGTAHALVLTATATARPIVELNSKRRAVIVDPFFRCVDRSPAICGQRSNKRADETGAHHFRYFHVAGWRFDKTCSILGHRIGARLHSPVLALPNFPALTFSVTSGRSSFLRTRTTPRSELRVSPRIARGSHRIRCRASTP